MPGTHTIMLLLQGTATLAQPKQEKNMLDWLSNCLFYDSHLIPSEIYENLLTKENVLLVDGPGTPKDWSLKNLFTTALGLIDGNMGENGKRASRQNIINFLKMHAEKATQENLELVITAIAWSRGGSLADEIPYLLAMLNIKAQLVQIHALDSAYGGPTDRLIAILSYFFQPNIFPEANIEMFGHISDTGNLHFWDDIWDFLQKYAPNTLEKFNTIFLSGSLSKIKSQTVTVNGNQYTHICENTLSPANHEVIGGRARTLIEKWIVDVIRADIIWRFSKLGIKFNKPWFDESLQKGNEGSEELNKIKSKINYEENRKFLDFKECSLNHISLSHMLFGRKLKPHEYTKITDKKFDSFSTETSTLKPH